MKYNNKYTVNQDEKSGSIINGSNTYINCDKYSVCVLPFFKNEHGQIKSVVLKNNGNYPHIKNKFSTCISESYDTNKYDTTHSCFKDLVQKYLNIDSISIDDIFYLGTVSHNGFLNKKHECYGLNLSNIYDSFDDLSNSELKNVRFSSIINGTNDDSLVLSCSALLLSYL